MFKRIKEKFWIKMMGDGGSLFLRLMKKIISG